MSEPTGKEFIMATLRDLVASGIPGYGAEQVDFPDADDNRMPKIAVDPFGLLYRPDPAVQFEYGVPPSNFDGETLADDKALGTLKAALIVIEERVNPPEIEPPEDETEPETDTSFLDA